MKILIAFFWINFFALSLLAQTSNPVLAAANGQNFTVQDLPAEVSENYLNLPKTVAETRKGLLAQMIAETLFELEAKAKGVSVEKLTEDVTARIPEPADKEIQAIYDNNREAIGDKTLAEVRPQIVAFLRREPEQKAFAELIAALKTKYKFVPGKDVNAVSLKPTDALGSIGARIITAQEFETKNKIALYEAKARVFDEVKFALNELIFSALVAAEAKAQNIETVDLMAREITDKLRDYTSDERETLMYALRKRLFTKYKTQILLKEPAPVVLNIAAAENPAKGAATAPVTIVMFSDFECPHCAAVHPILMKVLAEYDAQQTRFVLRDYPLTSIHANAFQAAVAANAARAQGKFFEYVEILYRNQTALDRESLEKYAADLGLNLKQFELDLQSEKASAEVRRDMADGKSYGITGTPTVYVNGVKVRTLSAEGFRQAIDKALKK